MRGLCSYEKRTRLTIFYVTVNHHEIWLHSMRGAHVSQAVRRGKEPEETLIYLPFVIPA